MLNASEIKEGDTVQVTSGGPVMTVARMKDDVAFCQWFDGSELKSGNLVAATLMHANATRPAAARSVSKDELEAVVRHITNELNLPGTSALKLAVMKAARG